MTKFFKTILALGLIFLATGFTQIEAQTYFSAPAMKLCNKCEGHRFCASCNGTGTYSQNPCAICSGSGQCYYCDGTGRL